MYFTEIAAKGRARGLHDFVTSMWAEYLGLITDRESVVIRIHQNVGGAHVCPGTYVDIH